MHGVHCDLAGGGSESDGMVMVSDGYQLRQKRAFADLYQVPRR
jgi:hypothetical protein